MQRKDNGPCFITQTSPKECKHQFYRKAIEESNNKNLEFFILKREFNYQFMRHCFDGGQLNDGTYPGLLCNIARHNVIRFWLANYT